MTTANLLVDVYLVAHTSSACSEFAAPSPGSVPLDREFVICADCEVES